MNIRRPVQDMHEHFLIDEFIGWWASRTSEQFQVISRPEPPEAIVQSEHRKTWIEVTDAFYSHEWAKDLYSNATPGEDHKPMEPGPHMEMDEQFSKHFVALLEKKLSKQSYADAYDKYGPGILLVGMQSPWFDGETCNMMTEACRNADWSGDKGYFCQIFISFRSMNQQGFREWNWKTL